MYCLLPILPSFSFYSHFAITHKGGALHIPLRTPYDKNLHLNRYFICTAHGLLAMSIPLVGGRAQHTAFCNLRIDYSENWQRTHALSLRTAYANSSWFAWYEEAFLKIHNKKHTFLIDRNMDFFNFLSAAFGVKKEIKLLDETLSRANTLAYIRDMKNRNTTPTQPYSYAYEKLNNDERARLSVFDLLVYAGRDSNTYLH